MKQFAWISTLALLCIPVMAIAQARSSEPADRAGGTATLEGRPVVDANGRVIGTVERVTPGPDGRPAQVLVRPKGLSAGGPRSLAASAVTVTEKAVRTPLTRSEFEAMPPVRPPSKADDASGEKISPAPGTIEKQVGLSSAEAATPPPT